MDRSVHYTKIMPWCASSNDASLLVATFLCNAGGVATVWFQCDPPPSGFRPSPRLSTSFSLLSVTSTGLHVATRRPGLPSSAFK
jgi:hypothetical protein